MFIFTLSMHIAHGSSLMKWEIITPQFFYIVNYNVAIQRIRVGQIVENEQNQP